MRKAVRDNPNKTPPSQVAVMQAPHKGWVSTLSPISAESGTAITLDNLFPEKSHIRLRNGCTAHVVGIAAEVQTLMSFVSGTTNKLFAAGDGKIYDVTSSGTLGAASISSLSVNKWQHTNVAVTSGQYLYIVNGTDAPRHYNGTTWATPTITGATAANFIHITTHKGRIWFVEKNSTTVYYLATDAIQGAVTAFPLGSQLKKGGYIMAACNWSVDAGEGMDDALVFWSSEGEMLVYMGTNPNVDYGIVGRYETSVPIGRRCMMQIGGDVAMLASDGVLALSTILRESREAVKEKALTNQIVEDYIHATLKSGSTFGWQMVTFPEKSMALVNVPDGSDDNKAIQFVYNISTRAWCRFTGWDAACWVYHKGAIYFGSTDGGVYRAEYGGSDNGVPIAAKCLPAFEALGAAGRTKHVKEIQPIFTTNLTNVSFGIYAAINFEFPTTAGTSDEAAGAGIFTWDVSYWDGTDVWGGSDIYDAWFGNGNIGYVVSPYTTVTVDADLVTNFDMTLIGWHVLYEPGGIAFSK